MARILAAAFLGVAVVAGSVVFVATRDQHPGSSANALGSTSSSAVVPTTVAPGTVRGFGVPEADVFGRRVDIPQDPAGTIVAQHPELQKKPTDPDWLTATPAGLCQRQSGGSSVCSPGGWQKVHGAVVPVSTSDGPTRIEAGVAAGYAHTPQGAALAAAYTVYEVAARPGDRILRSLRVLLTAADQQQFDTAAAEGRLPDQLDEFSTRWMLALDGFRVDQYSDDYAVVSLAARALDDGQQPTWSAATVPMVWHNGDWLLRGTGQQLPTRTIHDLAGWTTW
ncbi:hypothetical protein C5E45_23860 [Nocardia nova]|uniref:DUF8175 domain-containing protein n=1 Tax=Nocardia nova TaxID=37330 RepID=A0A2S6AKY2_9NOCA|nr:hypothetical protein C5E45_23860 [Nocardia nova]